MITTILRRYFLLPSIFLILVSCYPTVKRSYYPEEIMGEQIVFYTSKTELKQDRNIIAKDLFYNFHRDGSFTSTFEGDIYTTGTFDYKLKKNSNQASLAIHIKEKGKDIRYTIEMLYKSAYAGSWEVTYTTDPTVTTKEMGTFRFMK